MVSTRCVLDGDVDLYSRLTGAGSVLPAPDVVGADVVTGGVGDREAFGQRQFHGGGARVHRTGTRDGECDPGKDQASGGELTSSIQWQTWPLPHIPG